MHIHLSFYEIIGTYLGLRIEFIEFGSSSLPILNVEEKGCEITRFKFPTVKSTNCVVVGNEVTFKTNCSKTVNYKSNQQFKTLQKNQLFYA